MTGHRPTVVIGATLDTKGAEVAFVRREFERPWRRCDRDRLRHSRRTGTEASSHARRSPAPAALTLRGCGLRAIVPARFRS